PVGRPATTRDGQLVKGKRTRCAGRPADTPRSRIGSLDVWHHRWFVPVTDDGVGSGFIGTE
ncbi:MAG: hypothetical protein PVG71_10410, partial [Anaerolineae bacterium]